MRSLVFLLLTVIAFQIPWEELVVLGAFGTIIHAVGLGAAFVGLIALFTSGRVRGLLAMHWLMIAFVGFAAASIFWSQAVADPVGKIMTLAQLLAFSWLVWEFAPDLSQQKLLMQAYVWGSVLAVVIQLLGMRGYVEIAHEAGRFAAGTMNQNEFGFLLLIAIPMAVYCALDPKLNVLLRLAYLLSCPFCAVGILLTGSRMAFVVGCVMAAMIGVVYFFKRPVFVAVLSIGAVAIFLPLFMRVVPESTWDRLAKTGDEIQSGTLSGRLVIFQSAVELFEKYPVLGTGCGSFNDVIGRTIGATGAGSSAHNTYLSILVELGAVGLLLFLCVLAVGGLYTFKMPFRERYTWRIILLSWCLCAVAGHFESRKATWLVLAMISCQFAVFAGKGVAKVRAGMTIDVLDPTRQFIRRSYRGNSRGI
jgi:O-antigen ligase